MKAEEAAHAIEAALAVARVPDYHGQIPLHHAALRPGGADAVKALLAVHPDGANEYAGVHFLSRKTPLETALCKLDAQAPSFYDDEEKVLALLQTNPLAANTRTGLFNQSIRPKYPLQYTIKAGCSRATSVLLNLAPEVLTMSLAREIELDASTTEPRIHAMVLLARANYPPSRPWSTATAHVLRGIAAARPELTLIGEHMSRVRAFLLVARRLGIHSELALRLIGWLYHADLFG